MNIESLRRLFTFVILLLVQVIVFNHIHLFDVATPLLYVYLVLHFRRNHPRWATLLWCFLMGLLVDVFSNTPGVAAASMTFVGLLQPYLLEVFTPRDSADDLVASYRSLGVASFVYYVVILVFIYCLLFFLLENFTFFNWMHWMACTGASAVLTIIFILVIENFQKQ